MAQDSLPEHCMKLCGAAIKVALDWAIEDFWDVTSKYKVGKFLHTRAFSCGPHAFSLEVYPNGDSEHNKGWLTIALRYTAPHSVTVNGSMELLLPDWRSVPGGSWRLPMVNVKFDSDLNLLSMRIAMIREVDRRGMLSDNTLRFRLRLEPVLDNSSNVDVEDWKPNVAQQLRDHLEGMLQSSVKSDVTLVADGKEFPAHWNILCCRSKFFEGMLQAGLSEVRRERVEMQDDSETFGALLHFLYTGDVKDSMVVAEPSGTWVYRLGHSCLCYVIAKEDDHLTFVESDDGEFITGKLTEDTDSTWSGPLDNGSQIELTLRNSRMESVCTADDKSCHHSAYCTTVVEFWGRLLHAADKYCVPSLCDLCKHKLMQYLDVQSVAIILRIANSVGNQDLKNEALGFITHSEKRMREVQDTHSFDALDQELVKEVYECFVNPKCFQKRFARPAEELEFPDGSPWSRLTNAQLRRACAERELPTAGSRVALVASLNSQDSKG